MSHITRDELESPSTPAPKSYVYVDAQGVMRVGNSRVMLDSIVASFEQGHSAETIQQQYPALSLEEVYGVIAWYLAHVEDVSNYLNRQHAVWQHWRTEAAKHASPVVQRLRAIQKPEDSAPS